MLLCHTQCVCCGTGTFFLRDDQVVSRTRCPTCGRNLAVASGPFGEVEWLACDRPAEIVLWRDARTSPRKLRLFCAAACRAVAKRGTDPRVLEAIDTVERFADGQASVEELLRAGRGAQHVIASFTGITLDSAPYAAMQAAEEQFRPESVVAAVMTHPREDRGALAVRLAGLYRDVVGNPFRPLPALAEEVLAFNGGVLGQLARSIYDEHDFTAMPVLGDALEEAGCVDPFVLSHCHSSGEHTRGCWVVDVVLGRR
jgi:hypothetical protein